MNIEKFVSIITYFTLFYPIIMSLLWITGAIFYELLTKKENIEQLRNIKEEKLILLIPVYNEEEEIKNNITHNLTLNYSNYELWVIDDKSTDNSLEQLELVEDKKLKIFKNKENIGKAATLNKYIKLINNEYFLVIDSDTILDKDALAYFNHAIKKDKENENNKFVGYTGNITVKSNVKNKIFNIQKIEYRSFIDMIKRSQFILTKSIMTLSGACSCYKTQSVIDIGGFNETNATEDINISWRFNNNGFRLKYLSQAKASVSTPLNVYDIVKQRQRWTVGLLQTIFQNARGLFSLKNNFLKLYILEIIASSFWAFTLFFSSIYYILNILLNLYENLYLFNFIFGIILVLIFSILLSLIAYKISENNNEKLSVFFKNYFWFPFAYYLIQPLGFVFGLVDFIFKRQGGKWRQNFKESKRYTFATITDILITFIIFRIILELLEDSYSIFNNISLINLFYGYVIIKILFLLSYYLKFKVGNKFVDRNYPLVYNVSLYLSVISIIHQFYLIYLLTNNNVKVEGIYRFHSTTLLIYLAIIIVLTSIFSLILKKKHINKL